jgi:prefoldin subunit 4
MRRTKSRTRLFPKNIPQVKLTFSRYKIGDSFISLPLPEVQEMLSASTEKIEEEVAAVEEKLSTIREEMTQLKVELYARFGRSINLET